MTTQIAVEDKYVDPEGTPEILTLMRTLPTLGDIKELVDKTFPDWIVTVMEVYCPDYPHLQKNWREICKMTKSRPAQVMIVEDVVHDDAHSLVASFAECFTQAGFSVRRKREFIPCENCASAVPSQMMWHLFHQKGGFKIPEKWSPKCVGCQ